MRMHTLSASPILASHPVRSRALLPSPNARDRSTHPLQHPAPALGLDHLGQRCPVLGLGDVLADLGLGQKQLAVGDVQLVVQLRGGGRRRPCMVIDARMRSVGALLGYRCAVRRPAVAVLKRSKQ